ncbi:unnamed protein product [Arabidopsis arenosa]|uniref:Cytochrome P450 n=1 Tax=Arabidopsis arenosa TaxID=38785 RepID=A0A8S1ZXB0_ARAAE|nr:unnamed protein product [Arabidopsis arenosa]
MIFLFSTLQFSLFSLALVIAGYIFLGKKLSKGEVDSSTIPEPLGALPLFGHLHLLRGKELICKKLASISEKHGPIFSLKLGSYRLVVASDPKTVKECFTTNDLALATRPNIAFGRYVGYNNASLTLAPYGDYWRDLRKIVTVHLFSNQSIEMLGHIRSSELNTFIKHLYKGSGGTSIVKIDMLFEFLTFNIILRKMVGKRIGFGEVNSEEWRYKESLKHCEYLAVIPMIGDVIPWLGWLDFAKISQMKRLFKELDSVNTKWLQEHLKKRSRNEKDQERTIMDLLLDILPEDIVISGHVRDVIVKATILESAKHVKIVSWEDTVLRKAHAYSSTFGNFIGIPRSGLTPKPLSLRGLRVVHFVLARLLQGFELRKVSDEPVDMAEGPGLALPKINPVEVVVMPRLEPELYSSL